VLPAQGKAASASFLLVALIASSSEFARIILGLPYWHDELFTMELPASSHGCGSFSRSGIFPDHPPLSIWFLLKAWIGLFGSG